MTAKGTYSLCIFFTVVIFTEIAYQIFLRGTYPFKKSPNIVTVESFENRVAGGEKLVILDDMVLNVEKFMYLHPGGKFVIEQNIGRDVSKFFHGGYSMEPSNKQKPYRHSNMARVAANQMIIGTLHRPAVEDTYKVS